MAVPQRLRLAFSPKPECSRLDTGLRFTDILFGFVIAQLFLRLQNWAALDGFVQMQLVASTVLVLGSWIGFRRSLNRSAYELKFFNLPLLRFMLDQLMVLLYFRVAILTPTDPAAPVDAADLTTDTLRVLLYVFILYVLWDLGGLAMSGRWTTAASKYARSKADWIGFAISVCFLVLVAILWHVGNETDVDASSATLLLAVATALLISYRWSKEIRSSWKGVR